MNKNHLAIVLSFLVGFGIGCATTKKTDPIPTPWEGTQLLDELTQISPSGYILLADETYLCVSPKDEETLWWTPLDPPPYWPEAWDCDDIAIETLQLWKKAMILKLVAGNSGLGAGVAAGVINGRFLGYNPSTKDVKEGGYHHAFLVYRRNSGEWMAFDPQSGLAEPVLPAVKEKRVSIYFIWL